MAYKILIVDDDVDMLKMLALVLDAEGYGVLTAEDGDEAVRLAAENTPDLVLLNLAQPVEEGLVVAEKLKSEACSNVPIIAMSAADPMVARHRALACFEGWLPKPFRIETLLHFVAVAGEA